MAYNALNIAQLPFKLIRSEDIRNGKLKDYKMLFVPGGWASNKLKSLGEDGVNEIKNFVENGGSYLGFCGGAGLATLDGIGLLNIKRKPTKERLPSFSGRIHLNITEHRIWKGLIKGPGVRFKIQDSKFKIQDSRFTSSLVTRHSSLIFHAWWPSQFVIADNGIQILASYGDALPDSFSSDLNVGDVEANGSWDELEGIYKINLNPKRLLNEPAVVEGRYGKGKVILSLVHFDTPEDANGQEVLKNLWGYLLKSEVRNEKSEVPNSKLQTPDAKLTSDILALCSDLISLGERNFLWYWRNPMLIQWRRGVRGLEYCTLYVMVREIVQKCRSAEVQKKPHLVPPLAKGRIGGVAAEPPFNLNEIMELLTPFTDKAKRLLILERHAMQKGHITYEKCDDSDIQALRKELFSDSKSHGGMFKELIDEIDDLLFLLLTQGRV
ncbi:MAG: hypothetical protein HZA14_06755 [Nitrospirae bacterium]|nr:hypothetical protein [Nitrospirota bacterium]